MKLDYTMIVPVYNGTPFIDSFLASIDKYVENFEVVFVDNGSIDDSFEQLEQFCEKHSSCRVFRYSEKQSSYAARNFGAKHSTGKIFLFTDIDCILTEKYFDSLFELNELNGFSLYSGPTNIFLKSGNIYEYFDRSTYLLQEHYSKENYAATANLIVGRDLFNEVDGFDEFTSGADNKFCKKCNTAGYTVLFNEGLIVEHPPRDTLEEHLVKAKRLGIGHGESFVSGKPDAVKTLAMVLKQVFSLLIPIHSFRLFRKVFKQKSWKLSEVSRLVSLCYLVGFHQRIKIIKTVLKK